MNIFYKLKFTQKWIDLGIISPEKLVELETEWNKGEDIQNIIAGAYLRSF